MGIEDNFIGNKIQILNAIFQKKWQNNVIKMKKKKIILAICVICALLNISSVSAFEGETVLVVSGDGAISHMFPFFDVEKGDFIKINFESNGSTFTYIYGDADDVLYYNETNPSSTLIIKTNVVRSSGKIEVETEGPNWALSLYPEDHDVLITYEIEKSSSIPGYNNLILMSIIGITLIIIKRKK